MGIARRAIIYQERTIITAAMARAWHTTPIEVAQAPGANRIIHPLGLDMQYKYGTVPFSDLNATLALATLKLYLASATPFSAGVYSPQENSTFGKTSDGFVNVAFLPFGPIGSPASPTIYQPSTLANAATSLSWPSYTTTAWARDVPRFHCLITRG